MPGITNQFYPIGSSLPALSETRGESGRGAGGSGKRGGAASELELRHRELDAHRDLWEVSLVHAWCRGRAPPLPKTQTHRPASLCKTEREREGWFCRLRVWLEVEEGVPEGAGCGYKHSPPIQTRSITLTTHGFAARVQAALVCERFQIGCYWLYGRFPLALTHNTVVTANITSHPSDLIVECARGFAITMSVRV